MVIGEIKADGDTGVVGSSNLVVLCMFLLLSFRSFLFNDKTYDMHFIIKTEHVTKINIVITQRRRRHFALISPITITLFNCLFLHYTCLTVT